MKGKKRHMSKRVRGEGSVYQRKSDGRWIGAVTVGYNAAGRQMRKTVSAITADEAMKKMRAVQRKLDANEPLPDEQLTVRHLIERWQPIMKRAVKTQAYDNYCYIARVHIIPEIGHRDRPSSPPWTSTA